MFVIIFENAGLSLYFRNYLGHSKKGQGFIYKYVYTVEGSFANIIKVGALFAKRPQGGRIPN